MKVLGRGIQALASPTNPLWQSGQWTLGPEPSLPPCCTCSLVDLAASPVMPWPTHPGPGTMGHGHRGRAGPPEL